MSTSARDYAISAWSTVCAHISIGRLGALSSESDSFFSDKLL